MRSKSFQPVLAGIHGLDLLLLRHNTLVLSGPDVFQCTLEMAFRPVEVRVGFVLGTGEVGVDELDQTVEILRGDCLVLLVEVVDVAVEDFHEELDGYSCVHAGICNAEGTLKTLEDSFAIAVELVILLADVSGDVRD